MDIDISLIGFLVGAWGMGFLAGIFHLTVKRLFEMV